MSLPSYPERIAHAYGPLSEPDERKLLTLVQRTFQACAAPSHPNHAAALTVSSTLPASAPLCLRALSHALVRLFHYKTQQSHSAFSFDFVRDHPSFVDAMVHFAFFSVPTHGPHGTISPETLQSHLEHHLGECRCDKKGTRLVASLHTVPRAPTGISSMRGSRLGSRLPLRECECPYCEKRKRNPIAVIGTSIFLLLTRLLDAVDGARQGRLAGYMMDVDRRRREYVTDALASTTSLSTLMANMSLTISPGSQAFQSAMSSLTVKPKDAAFVKIYALFVFQPRTLYAACGAWFDLCSCGHIGYIISRGRAACCGTFDVSFSSSSASNGGGSNPSNSQQMSTSATSAYPMLALRFAASAHESTRYLARRRNAPSSTVTSSSTSTPNPTYVHTCTEITGDSIACLTFLHDMTSSLPDTSAIRSYLGVVEAPANHPPSTTSQPSTAENTDSPSSSGADLESAMEVYRLMNGILDLAERVKEDLGGDEGRSFLRPMVPWTAEVAGKVWRAMYGDSAPEEGGRSSAGVLSGFNHGARRVERAVYVKMWHNVERLRTANRCFSLRCPLSDAVAFAAPGSPTTSTNSPQSQYGPARAHSPTPSTSTSRRKLFQRCAGCKVATFCSPTCLRAAWSDPSFPHKHACKDWGYLNDIWPRTLASLSGSTSSSGSHGSSTYGSSTYGSSTQNGNTHINGMHAGIENGDNVDVDTKLSRILLQQGGTSLQPNTGTSLPQNGAQQNGGQQNVGTSNAGTSNAGTSTGGGTSNGSTTRRGGVAWTEEKLLEVKDWTWRFTLELDKAVDSRERG